MDVGTDTIYANNENRTYCTKAGIVTSLCTQETASQRGRNTERAAYHWEPTSHPYGGTNSCGQVILDFAIYHCFYIN